MLWTIELMKTSLNEQLDNTNMNDNEKKVINQPLLLDTVPIENYIFSLLHAEIGVGNKTIENYFYGLLKESKKCLKKKLF